MATKESETAAYVKIHWLAPPKPPPARRPNGEERKEEGEIKCFRGEGEHAAYVKIECSPPWGGPT